VGGRMMTMRYLAVFRKQEVVPLLHEDILVFKYPSYGLVTGQRGHVV